MEQQELLRLIEEAAADQRTILDLSGQGLTEIPEAIGQLQNLNILNLSNNQISNVPEAISNLQNLKELYLGNNQITEIPEAIGNLQNLTRLYLGNNRISEIPEATSQLQNLKILNLDNNRISEIPEAISNLQNLNILFLSNNQITEIPEVIGNLQNLNMLDLRNNQIKKTSRKIYSFPGLNINGNYITSLTEIGASGFKSFVNLTKIRLGSLSILAGTNSSGKSSIMQPLLLLKQTIEANYDPGILLLDGPNVSFTDSEQFISMGMINNNRSNKFQIFTASHTLDLQINFQWSKETNLSYHSQQFTLKSQGLDKISLREGMTTTELAKIPLYKSDQMAESLQVIRERCFLRVKGLTTHLVDLSLTQALRSMIHVPGVRGNPERVYKTAATNGKTFTGLFEKYVASVIDRFQKQEPEKLIQLQSHLQKLGLTDKIEAQRLNETQLELRVSRVVGSPDTVNIADVGFGVSQVLPVIVALLVAEPSQIVYIEQPEIHLHPRAQVALAEIFAEAINRGVQVIVETHSELFLLGIQTLVAENKIAPQDVQLHWFTRNPVDGSSTVTTAELDETGAFGDWPEDFGSTALDLQHRYLTSAEQKLWENK